MNAFDPRMNRRRFLSIAAAATGVLATGTAPSSAAPVTSWKGVAMGARASMELRGAGGADPEQAIESCLFELSRLENIFSLYRRDSTISRLNRDGVLRDPPPELLELLALSGAIHAATGGAFDPTVQPLWDHFAKQSASSNPKQDEDAGHVGEILEHVGWDKISYDSAQIRFSRPGMAITLNGIAQGYISDRIGVQLRRHGFGNVLVDMGEIAALGTGENGAPWRVGVADPIDGSIAAKLAVRDQAVATSSPLGTALPNGIGHIFDPRRGSTKGVWRRVTVTAPKASLADGYSTAFCLMSGAEIRNVVDGDPDLSVVFA